ncbi:FIG01024707: hypothetical protein [hydrothermal vent metagenome]|uniref:Lipoprotein n=1 Tax=hydrothermal vent metagenome TaxID=652676 RepID=A0A3B0RS99_9ZZZZ
MRKFMAVLIISSVALSGCGGLRDSKANPANWFGKRNSGPVATATGEPAEVNPLIPQKTSVFRRNKSDTYIGTPVSNIISMSVEKLPTGAIIHVVGVSQLQGAYDARLISDSKGDPVNGALTFKLKAVQPLDQAQGSQKSRTIHTAQFVSNGDLENTSVIQIIGSNNVISRKN